MVRAMVMMTAHVRSDSQTCDTLCMLSMIEKPLSDFLFVVILDVMRGNFPLRASWRSSVHFSMSSISHELSFVRMHRPPNLSVWQRSWMNVDTGSVIVVLCDIVIVCTNLREISEVQYTSEAGPFLLRLNEC